MKLPNLKNKINKQIIADLFANLTWELKGSVPIKMTDSPVQESLQNC